jgi:hypothetical protein
MIPGEEGGRSAWIRPVSSFWLDSPRTRQEQGPGWVVLGRAVSPRTNASPAWSHGSDSVPTALRGPLGPGLVSANRFSLLRLTGARLATLRRVVALEGAVPLLAVSAVAIATGFGAAAMFASEAQQHPMVAPGAAYYLITAGGILASLGIIAATFPLLARITGPEVARNE